jgi:hypothetical protein
MTAQRFFRVAACVSVAVLALGWHLRVDAAQDPVALLDTPTWFCPMHPDVTSAAPGKCRKCDMTLVSGNPFDTRDYELDVTTSPAAIQAGVPFRLTLQVRHPGTGAVVTEFEQIHDKRYHLFVIGDDMTSFQHIHPAEQPDGSWTLDVTVPKPTRSCRARLTASRPRRR